MGRQLYTTEKYRILGLKIAYYRKKAGYTQEVFAEKINKSVNFLAQVEVEKHLIACCLNCLPQ